MLRSTLLTGFVVSIAMVGCSASSEVVEEESAESELREAPLADPVSRDRVPEPQAFKGWSEDTSMISEPRPADVQRVSIGCADKTLVPTHPQSSLKTYHRYARGDYDAAKLLGDSELCRVKGNGRNTWGQVPCLAPDAFQYVMLSDTYVDHCGNYYRGFWEELFVLSQETMGTLLSKGRTVYEVPNAEFHGEVYDAGTYELDADTFVFFSKLFPGDADRIETAKNQVQSAGTHRLDPDTGLFEYVGPYH